MTQGRDGMLCRLWFSIGQVPSQRTRLGKRTKTMMGVFMLVRYVVTRSVAL